MQGMESLCIPKFFISIRFICCHPVVVVVVIEEEGEIWSG